MRRGRTSRQARIAPSARSGRASRAATGKQLDGAPRPSLKLLPSTPDAHEGHLVLHSPGHPACEARHEGLVPPLLLSGREGLLTALCNQGTHSSEPNGGTTMQAHTLGVGE